MVRHGVVVALGAVLAGCPTTAVVCQPGTEACGSGCIDPVVDVRNCGGCGIACGANQTCSARTCSCQAGTTSCGGECVVTASDSANCGACGVRCAATEVCELGTCREACLLGSSVRCGSSCVDITADLSNCGGCGVVCSAGQRCRAAACTHDVVAACASSGQVAGLDGTTLARGPLASVGTSPAALAAVPGGVLVLDGVESRLYQAAVTPGGVVQATQASEVDGVPTAALVDGVHVYVVSQGSGALQVLRQGADGGVVPVEGGALPPYPMGTVAGLALGPGSGPAGVARLGRSLWIPLAAEGSPAVVEVSVADPSAPVEARRISLGGLAAPTADGGAATLRPRAVVAHLDAGYVVLDAVGGDGGLPAGQGLLARIAASGAVTPIFLGGDCLAPRWVTPVGASLAVSCAGQASAGAGVLLLDDAGVRTARWSAACPSLTDAGPCTAMEPGRMAARGARLFVADEAGGRVVVLDAVGGVLTEVRGLSAPLHICPAGGVSDVVALP